MPNKAIEGQCTCDSGEFVTAVCPVHSKIGLSENSKPIEINDGFLCSPKPITISGYLFQCPSCENSTIIVNRNYIPKVCCECKKDIVIQSKVFSDAIREENQSLNATEIAIGQL